MGSPKNEAGRNPGNEAQVEVELTRRFWMGKFEVTREEYEEVTWTNPASSHDAGKRAPTEAVRWVDAMDFCEKLTGCEREKGKLPKGWTYTLPTGAQWEYACRAREEGSLSGGTLDEVAWWRNNSGGKAQPVGQKKSNAWGVHDMLGNISEWCLDWYAEKLSGRKDPAGPNQGEFRGRRGGSWVNRPFVIRCAFRRPFDPGSVDINLGFRVVLVPSAGSAESPSRPPEPVVTSSGLPNPGSATKEEPFV